MIAGGACLLFSMTASVSYLSIDWEEIMYMMVDSLKIDKILFFSYITLWLIYVVTHFEIKNKNIILILT